MRLFLIGDTPVLRRVSFAFNDVPGLDVHSSTHLQLEEVLDYRPDAMLTDQAVGDWDSVFPDHNMFRTNSTAAAVCGMAASAVGAHLYHLSDPYVFPGSRAYRDTDKPYPASVYGFTRALGEKAVRALHPKVGIIRVGWLYGPDIPTSVPAMAQDALNGERSPVGVYEDVLGSPTYVGDAAAVLAFHIMQGLIYGLPFTGTFHLSTDLVTDWYTYLNDDFPVVPTKFRSKVSKVWHRNAALVPSEGWEVPHGGLDRFRSDIKNGSWSWTDSLLAK